MIKESKYIIRRILIGVGIVLVLGFLRSNKVYALDGIDLNSQQVSYSTVSSDLTYQYIGVSDNIVRVYKNRDNSNWAVCSTQLNTCRVFVPSQFLNFTNVGIATDNNTNKQATIWFTDNCSLPITTENSTSNKFTFQCTTLETKFIQGDNAWAVSSAIGVENEKGRYVTGWRDSYTYYSNVAWIPYLGGSSTLIEFLPPSTPDFVSWHWTKITNNNIITGISLRPEFSTWDTTNYDYQYKIGKNSTTWLSLSENQQLFTFHNNGVMLYIRVKNKNDNSIVFGANFTTSNIGTFYESPEYNINFSGEYRTDNYLNNNVSKSQSIIKEYQIYVDYLPKSSILKYQYQYITSGTCSDIQTWEQVSSDDNGSFTYVASQNGTLCARILDSTDTVQYDDSFEVSTIGLLALNNNSSKLYNFFDSIRNKIDFGGPIGSLVNIPITLLQTISNGFTGATGVCTDYNLGNLWGTNLKLPCVNIKQHLGNQLYTIIDVICACCMFYMMVKMLTNAYYKFLLMEHTPVQEHIGRDY